MRRIRRRVLLAQGLATLVAFALLLGVVDLAPLARRLAGIDPVWAAGGVAVLLVQSCVAGWRWHAVAALFGAPLALRRALEYFLLAQGCSQLLPASVGGDAVRTALHAHTGATWRAAAVVVVADRICGVAALVGLGAMALRLPEARVLDLPLAAALGPWCGLLLLGGLLLVPPAASPLGLARLAGTQVPPASPGLGLRRGAALLAASVLVHLCSVVAMWMLGRAAGVGLSPGVLCVTLPAALVVTVLPVSLGGWGLREGTLVALLGLHGVAPDAALATSVLFGLALVAASLPGAVLWLARRRRAGAMPEPVDRPGVH